MRLSSMCSIMSCGPFLHCTQRSLTLNYSLAPLSQFFVSILCSLRTVELNQRWLSLNPWTCWLRPSEFQVSRFPLFGGDPQENFWRWWEYVFYSGPHMAATGGFVILKWNWHNWEQKFEFRVTQSGVAQSPALERLGRAWKGIDLCFLPCLFSESPS